jgi:hypothetical protein
MSSDFSIELQGLDSLLDDLKHFQADIRKLVNGELRRESKEIATAALPTVRRLVAAGRTPQSRKMADTARAKSDRMPIVRIGAVNPKLSGFRRGSNSDRMRGSLAWGVEKGPAGGPRGRLRSNVYGVPRSSGGYVIGPHVGTIADAVVPAYADALERAMHNAGLLIQQGV